MSVLPDGTEEEILARLPFAEAQEALAGEPIDPRAALVVDVGWHGNEIDAALGAYAVAERDGPVADLLGSRLRVTNLRTGRSVYVLLHALASDLGDDVTLTRRAMLQIAELSAETTRCAVEAVG